MPPTASKKRGRHILRTEAGQFLKKCGSKYHDDGDDCSPLYHIHKGKKIKKATLESFLKLDMITKQTTYLCHACVHKQENNDMDESFDDLPCEETDNNITLSSSFETANDLSLCNSDSSSMSFEDAKSPLATVDISNESNNKQNLMSNCIHIGQMLDTLIKNDIKSLYKDQNKCSVEQLLAYNPEAWLAERPPELVDLMRVLCGSGENMAFKAAKAIEHIYGCRNSKLVLPLSFQESILIYSMSRSKSLISYTSKLNPSGSYDYLTKWMSDQATTELSIPPGIVRSVFDNEQVIGKTYKVQAENKVPMSIVTSHIYISINQFNEIQSNDTFAPSNWLFQKPSDIQKEEFLNESKENTEFFRHTRNMFIKERLISVKGEHNDIPVDYIDKAVTRKAVSENEKVCVSCGAENENTSRKCTNCKGYLIKEKPNMSDLYPKNSKIQPYKHFSSIEIHENQFEVYTGEPDMLNPNSFQSISNILFNLGNRGGLKQYNGSDRSWLFVECDGGIYAIVDKLIFNVLRCDKCQEAIYGEDSFAEHRCSLLHESGYTHEFGWVIPMPGLLHIEMNACKLIFEINWDIILKDICKKLGYITPKSLEYAKRCCDHHKTWSILEIMYIAVADELLVPFVRHCKLNDMDINVENYWQWSGTVCNPNYLYLQQMIFTFLHGLMLFRAGCRKGNSRAIVAGRSKLSLLFYTRNHPRYQRILALNKYMETMMPEEVKEILYSSFTLSRIGNTGHYQGGDACLEEVNKEAKAWIKQSGVPSEKEWLRVFRNMDSMNKVKTNFQELLDGKDDITQATKTEYVDRTIRYEEVEPIRVLLRQNMYLMKPHEYSPHVSLDGQTVLNHQLASLTGIAETRHSQYLNSFLNDSETFNSKNVVCVTENEIEECGKVENMTKKDITLQIMSKIESLPPDVATLQEEVFNKTVKAKNKNSYLEFFYSLSEN